MVRRGEIDKLRAYCEGDCLNLFVLYVWWALLSGRIDPAGHNASLQSLIECLESENDARPRFGKFLDRWCDDSTHADVRAVRAPWRALEIHGMVLPMVEVEMKTSGPNPGVRPHRATMTMLFAVALNGKLDAR